METRFFAPAYMRLLYRFLNLSSRQERGLFDATPIVAADLLAVEPTVPFVVQMQICRNALKISEPGLGLRMGRQLQLATHGALGIAMQNATDLDEALEVYTEFCATRGSFFALRRETRGDRHAIVLTFDGLDSDLVPFFAESILATIDHCLTFYASSSELGSSIDLAFSPPSYANQYRTAFDAAVSFDALQTAFEIPTAILSTSTYDRDPILFTDAIRRCRQEIGFQRDSACVAANIEEFLRHNLGKLWTVDELAQVLNTSKRTLLRRLRSEQTSYQEIRDRLLREHAALYLRSMTVETVTKALGFADESSFRRSFKRWYGVTPSQHREATLHQSTRSSRNT